jgi:hypothetical protein
MKDGLKQRRSELMRRTVTPLSPIGLLEIQLDLAAEIRRSEDSMSAGNVNLRWHIHLLRCCGDCLAWKFLHPHAIRQVSKQQPAKPSLTNQGTAFDFTLEKARELAEAGHPVLIADLTHCLRIGDLVLATDSERPELIECKMTGRPERFELQGRRGRQISRMRSTTEYLRSGRARIYGEELTRQVIEINVAPEFNWSTVAQVCANANTSRQASTMLSSGELIYATTEDDEIVPNEIREGLFTPRYSVVASHFVPIEEAWSIVPPPLSWDIPPDMRIALQEGDLMLFHIFDPHVVVGYSNSDGTVVGFESHVPDDDHGYRIRIGQTQLITGANFTRSLLYGYETAQSMANRMIASAVKALAVIPPEIHPLLAQFD